MGISAPSQEARAAASEELRRSRIVAQPLSDGEIKELEAHWTRDGLHHHTGATATIHRLLATIAGERA